MDLYVVDPDPQGVIERENVCREYVSFEQPMIPSVIPIRDIDIIKEQKACPEIGPIYRFIESGDLPDNDYQT